jgi:hypothetical protein
MFHKTSHSAEIVLSHRRLSIQRLVDILLFGTDRFRSAGDPYPVTRLQRFTAGVAPEGLQVQVQALARTAKLAVVKEKAIMVRRGHLPLGEGRGLFPAVARVAEVSALGAR